MLITPAVLKKLINPYTVTYRGWWNSPIHKKGNCQKNLTSEFFVQLQKQVSAKNCVFFAMGGLGGIKKEIVFKKEKDNENEKKGRI